MTTIVKHKKLQADTAARVKIEQVDLKDFLNNTLPLMIYEMQKTTKAFQYYQVEWGADNEQNLILKSNQAPVFQQEVKTGFQQGFENQGLVSKYLQASCLSWNNRGVILAVGYSRGNHSGWCPHKSVIRIWYPFRQNKHEDIEVDGCLSSVSFYPNDPFLLVAGTFNGQLMMFDLNKPDPLVSVSTIDQYQHREAITGLVWAIGVFDNPSLYSVSTDAKVLHWKHDSLRVPLRGFVLRLKSDLQGGLCLGMPMGDTGSLFVGTQAGKVMRLSLPELNTVSLGMQGMKWKPEAQQLLNNLDQRYRPRLQMNAQSYATDLGLKEVDVNSVFNCKPELNRMYPNIITFLYQTHQGPVTSLACNPFNHNLLVSASTDGTARLYSAISKQALIELEPAPNKKINCVNWSNTRPLVLAVGTQTGKVFLYDFLQSEAAPVAVMGFEKEGVSALEFNKSLKDLIAVTYQSGVTHIVQLSSVFSTPHPDEQRRLILLLKKE